MDGSAESLKALLKAGRYAELKASLKELGLKDLAAAWPALAPMEKAVAFKLLDPKPALDFYSRLPFVEKYFLLCAFDPNSIAPVLENLSPAERSLFHRLPEECYNVMFHQVVTEQVEIQLTIQKN